MTLMNNNTTMVDCLLREISRTKQGRKHFSLSGLLTGIMDWIIVVCCIGLTGAIPFLREGSFVTDHDSTIRFALYILIIFRCVICMPKGIKTSQAEIITLIGIGVSFAVSLLAGVKSVLYAAGRVYVPIIVGIVVALTTDEKQLCRFMTRFVKVMTVIAFAALIFWWYASVMHRISSDAVIQYLWDEERSANVYCKIYYESDWQQFFLLGQDTYKNCGLFAEPPMFGYLLCLSWMFHRMMHKSLTNGWYVYLILGLTVLSTFSVTAIISILLFEGIIFGFKTTKNIYLKLFKYLVFLCLCFLVFIYATGLIEDKLQSGSGSARKAHLLISFKSFFQHPINGLGFGNARTLQSLSGYKQGLSIGLPAVWALGGIGILFVTLIPFISLGMRCINKKQWRMLAYSIASFWIYFCTAVFFISPIPWIAIICMIKHLDGEVFVLHTTI